MQEEDIRKLARDARVSKHPRYHANQHHLRFVEIVDALQYCFRVKRDNRTHPGGFPKHPDGYRAWCHASRKQVLIVDFDLERAHDGNYILVVTAFERKVL